MNNTLSPASRLREEFSEKQALFNAQPVIVQRFIEAQARQVAEALIGHQPQVDGIIDRDGVGQDGRDTMYQKLCEPVRIYVLFEGRPGATGRYGARNATIFRCIRH